MEENSMKHLTEEEFSNLNLEDMKKHIIELLEEVPDENMQELYEGVKQIYDEYDKENNQK